MEDPGKGGNHRAASVRIGQTKHGHGSMRCTTLGDLRDPGPVVTLDTKVLAGLSRIARGSLRTQFLTIKESEANKGGAVRGRQVLLMYDQYFRTNEDRSRILVWLGRYFENIILHGDDLKTFMYTWGSVIAGMKHTPDDSTMRDLFFRQRNVFIAWGTTLTTWKGKRRWFQTHLYLFLERSVSDFITSPTTVSKSQPQHMTWLCCSEIRRNVISHSVLLASTDRDKAIVGHNNRPSTSLSVSTRSSSKIPLRNNIHHSGQLLPHQESFSQFIALITGAVRHAECKAYMLSSWICTPGIAWAMQTAALPLSRFSFPFQGAGEVYQLVKHFHVCNRIYPLSYRCLLSTTDRWPWTCLWGFSSSELGLPGLLEPFLPVLPWLLFDGSRDL